MLKKMRNSSGTLVCLVKGIFLTALCFSNNQPINVYWQLFFHMIFIQSKEIQGKLITGQRLKTRFQSQPLPYMGV